MTYYVVKILQCFQFPKLPQFIIGAAKVQQKMHICNKIARKFTFVCDFIANGLHYATVLSGELL